MAKGTRSVILKDAIAGVVVFLVALPLCLGVAIASGADPMAGLIAGIIGGIVVGLISQSATSVSGPAAGLTAVVLAQIASLGSFENFLAALVVAGLIQIALGWLQAGSIAAFFPSPVIKGLMAAIGVILILKQIPHLVGHDSDPEGDFAFFQIDKSTTLGALWDLVDDFDVGAALIGLTSLLLLIRWEQIRWLRESPIPAVLVVVVCGVGLGQVFETAGHVWDIPTKHYVQIPVAESLGGFLKFLRTPNWSALGVGKIYLAGVTLAFVSSLETLLNLKAVDKLDPEQRTSPRNRELIAQGVGNILAGCLGGIPVTSVVVRGSVNIDAGAKTKFSAIFHGVLLLVCTLAVPQVLNLIPLSCLAAILVVTGFKLANPAEIRRMWNAGRSQFIPFAVTVTAIVFTDLLIGIVVGLFVSMSFVLASNLQRPLRRVVEKHVGGDVLRIELANQVSFLSRAILEKTLKEVPRGGHVLLDARQTDYIDPDILALFDDFQRKGALAHGVSLSMLGFDRRFQVADQIQYVDFSNHDLQRRITPSQVLQILKEGNERFRTGQLLTRSLSRLLNSTSAGQFPVAAVLSCIDSRSPAEIIFDLGLGDIFSVRIAGNVSSNKVLGSLEYAVSVAGAKLILVLGHTNCGAIRESLAPNESVPQQVSRCEHLHFIAQEIQEATPAQLKQQIQSSSDERRQTLLDEAAGRNVQYTRENILLQSRTIRELAAAGTIQVVGALYNIRSGQIEFFDA